MGVFSIGMARMVGDHGWVIAVDLQQEMLNILRRRALKAGVSHRIHTHRCTPTEVGVHQKVGFALAFWMVHEVPDTHAFFKQILSCLRPEGAFLVAEPRYHVSARAFRLMVSQAESTGLKLCEEPRIRFSRAALFGP
jgi:ubiquinone/menaquinone biosynthesis C-methylase UbiE